MGIYQSVFSFRNATRGKIMKRILLASASIVAFAGAAAAEVTFGGDAEFGYNDTVGQKTPADEPKGFYYSFGLSVAGSMELDNGLTAAMSGDVTIGGADTFDSNNVAIDDLKVSLSSDTASLTYGDVAPAADQMWSGVGNMQADGFNDEDDIANEDGQLVGMVQFGDTKVGISTAVVDGDMEGMQLGVTGSAGSFSYGLAYQEETYASGVATGNSIFGVRVGMTFGGADVALAHADNGTANSTGISVSYPVGSDVTLGA
ncbi:MAG: porin, partial [Pseudomonadota bacterium]